MVEEITGAAPEQTANPHPKEGIWKEVYRKKTGIQLKQRLDNPEKYKDESPLQTWEEYRDERLKAEAAADAAEAEIGTEMHDQTAQLGGEPVSSAIYQTEVDRNIQGLKGDGNVLEWREKLIETQQGQMERHKPQEKKSE